jgi:hypothetical protein
MQPQPSVIATGDFLYFAPAGKTFTVPAAGIVSATSKPGATDPIWTDYMLGTVMKPSQDKYSGKTVTIKAPMPGTGIVAPVNIIRPSHELTMEVEMNELSRLALAGFYKAVLIEPGDTLYNPLARGAGLQGWLKRQRYDQNGNIVAVDDWYVDLDCTDLATQANENIINPKFLFTWLYSPLAGSAI